MRILRLNVTLYAWDGCGVYGCGPTGGLTLWAESILAFVCDSLYGESTHAFSFEIEMS